MKIGKNDCFVNCFLFSCKNQFEILVRSSESSWCWRLIESIYETLVRLNQPDVKMTKKPDVCLKCLVLRERFPE